MISCNKLFGGDSLTPSKSHMPLCLSDLSSLEDWLFAAWLEERTSYFRQNLPFRQEKEKNTFHLCIQQISAVKQFHKYFLKHHMQKCVRLQNLMISLKHITQTLCKPNGSKCEALESSFLPHVSLTLHVQERSVSNPHISVPQLSWYFLGNILFFILTIWCICG